MKDMMRIVSVDLGQARDYTAISVTERGVVQTGEPFEEEIISPRTGWPVMRTVTPRELQYHVRHLERPRLGTPYPEVVERVVDLIAELGGELALTVDATGVGRPVVDLLKERLNESLEGTSTQVTPCWVTITGGDSVNRAPGGMLRVPKRDLVSAPLVLLQNGQLKIAEALELREALVKELLAFRVKINISTAHDSYEAWREGDHDDLVLSVAMACWAGERFFVKPQLAKVYSF